MVFGRFLAYKKVGVLGINKRNSRYILEHNPRALFPLVDDKIATKQLCKEHNIQTPELFGSISAHHQIRQLEQMLSAHKSFVLKPASGAMGNGVLIIAGKEGELFRKASGTTLSIKDIRYHVSSILSGLYSLGGRSDRTMIEERVRVHSVFSKLAMGGVPDCRVIVFRGVPIMSMLRLPTRMSDGRANLHQGAIAAGVDITNGITHHAVHLDRAVVKHPDSGLPVNEIEVPYWDEILLISARCADMTGLGYLGVDVVVDAKKGPMLLELNARPGLSIQTANAAGLLPLLESVENRELAHSTPEERVELARGLFAAHRERLSGEDSVA